MKKLAVLGLLLAMSTGCGRGWFPHLFRGAPCNGLCSAPAPSFGACNDCAPGAYGAHDVNEGYLGNEVIGSAGIGPTYETLPQMQTLPATPGTVVPGTIVPK